MKKRAGRGRRKEGMWRGKGKGRGGGRGGGEDIFVIKEGVGGIIGWKRGKGSRNDNDDDNENDDEKKEEEEKQNLKGRNGEEEKVVV